MILNVVLVAYLFLVWIGLVWLYREMRKQDRRLKEINAIIAEMNRDLQWIFIQRVALSILLWQVGGRGVMQMEVPLPPDGSLQKIVTVSVTSNAVVVSSPGEEEFVIKMEG